MDLVSGFFTIFLYFWRSIHILTSNYIHYSIIIWSLLKSLFAIDDAVFTCIFTILIEICDNFPLLNFLLRNNTDIYISHHKYADFKITSSVF